MREEILSININDTTFKIDASFSPEYWRDINAGQWENHTFDILDHFTSKSSVAIDIGCWAGPVSLYMASNGAHVFSIDPDPIAFQALRNNINLNPGFKSRVQPYQLAIAPHSQLLPIYARKAYGHSSTSLLPRARDRIATMEAEGCSLQKFIEDAKPHKIDFIKVDIEGGEFAIINDLVEVIEKYDHPTVYISLHFSHLNESLYRKKLGVRVLSLLLLKFEEYAHLRLFGRSLRKKAEEIIALARRFNHVYDQFGNAIPPDFLTAQYLLSQRIDLVLTNTAWKV